MAPPPILHRLCFRRYGGHITSGAAALLATTRRLLLRLASEHPPGAAAGGGVALILEDDAYLAPRARAAVCCRNGARTPPLPFLGRALTRVGPVLARAA